MSRASSPRSDVTRYAAIGLGLALLIGAAFAVHVSYRGVRGPAVMPSGFGLAAAPPENAEVFMRLLAAFNQSDREESALHVHEDTRHLVDSEMLRFQRMVPHADIDDFQYAMGSMADAVGTMVLNVAGYDGHIEVPFRRDATEAWKVSLPLRYKLHGR